MQLVHETRPVVPRDRLIRMSEVETLTGLGKTSIYELMKAGKFPRSIRLHARLVAWPETAVLSWVQSRIQEGQQ